MQRKTKQSSIKRQFIHHTNQHPSRYLQEFEKGLFTFYCEQSQQELEISNQLHHRNNNFKPERNLNRNKCRKIKSQRREDIGVDTENLEDESHDRQTQHTQTINREECRIEKSPKQNKGRNKQLGKKVQYRSITQCTDTNNSQPIQRLFRRRHQRLRIGSVQKGGKRIHRYCPTTYCLNSKLQKQIELISQRIQVPSIKKEKRPMKKHKDKHKQSNNVLSLPKINENRNKSRNNKPTQAETSSHQTISNLEINNCQYPNKIQEKHPINKFVMISSKEYATHNDESQLMKLIKRFCGT